MTFLQMHSQCAHKYAEATDRRDKALEHAACLEKHLAGVLHKLETMEQSLAEVMVGSFGTSDVLTRHARLYVQWLLYVLRLLNRHTCCLWHLRKS